MGTANRDGNNNNKWARGAAGGWEGRCNKFNWVKSLDGIIWCSTVYLEGCFIGHSQPAVSGAQSERERAREWVKWIVDPFEYNGQIKPSEWESDQDKDSIRFDFNIVQISTTQYDHPPPPQHYNDSNVNLSSIHPHHAHWSFVLLLCRMSPYNPHVPPLFTRFLNTKICSLCAWGVSAAVQIKFSILGLLQGTA